ncbi:zinc-binding alcohol dehydrogenase family protein [Moellerella wisconsensis]|uniref:Zinc-type alcohol dehydrogenase-like protein n=1 Tax=Moellerella wisconsensis ATCC 35017 TaxID=1354267 RepID=A0A0N0IBL1_9GAMM|nr:zinc-binding alcohol dehydrogenase family protein [Moellerella wisconsensis]KPD03983.1 zinc-containing alcohol dehydrogenase/quinone oxidoreductase [Moellerella wisconsensis ATCC 35017]VFS49861.1 Zinc-type alcohol dehydrogenase-like protein SA1988 [Moellerella wisconsensis]
MKAIVFSQPGLPISDKQALYQTEVPKPEYGERDLLVKIEAIAVNPVDTKVRHGDKPATPRILGWDACGRIEAVGRDVQLFKPGDYVYYAGSIARQGCYAEYGVVDERIAGHKPSSLDATHAAALPLTSITAWELLFDRLGAVENQEQGRSLLVIGAAGGVGSMLIQLASQLTQLRVIGTASRPETQDWVKALGADDVIDHSKPLKPQLATLGIENVDYVASLTHTDDYFNQIIDILIPQGKLALIDDPKVLDVMPMKRKALSLHWELMFTRPVFQTADMIRQHEILDRVATLIDNGQLRTTLSENFGLINADNLRRAHALLEQGQAKGKIVLAGFE